MIDYKAQHLTKSQLNEIRGGATYHCNAFKNGKMIPMPAVEASSAEDAADQVHAETGADQVNCTLA